jgi:hypothetical protein
LQHQYSAAAAPYLLASPNRPELNNTAAGEAPQPILLYIQDNNSCPDPNNMNS